MNNVFPPTLGDTYLGKRAIGAKVCLLRLLANFFIFGGSLNHRTHFSEDGK